jgi:hypothetical protein
MARPSGGRRRLERRVETSTQSQGLQPFKTSGLLVVCALLAVAPAAAFAQLRSPRVEVGVGGGIIGGLSLGDRDAMLPATGTTGSPIRLFSTETTLEPAAALDIRLGYQVTPRLMVEGLLSVGQPTLTTSLANDVENAAAVEATASLTEYVVTGGAAWRLSRNPRRRWIPFVSGGGGVARHVYEGRALVESGVDVYAGGGILHALSARTGVRLDARVHVLRDGVAEGQGASPRAALSGSIFVRF